MAILPTADLEPDGVIEGFVTLKKAIAALTLTMLIGLHSDLVERPCLGGDGSSSFASTVLLPYGYLGDKKNGVEVVLDSSSAFHGKTALGDDKP